jgi:hypothetical protein
MLSIKQLRRHKNRRNPAQTRHKSRLATTWVPQVPWRTWCAMLQRIRYVCYADLTPAAQNAGWQAAKRANIWIDPYDKVDGQLIADSKH